MNSLQPTVGQWYLRRVDGLKFEVIDVDDGDGYIEVQDEDGLLDQIDSDEWSSVDLELTTQPEDPSTVFDNIAEPDEADGGDATERSVIDESPMRVANADRINGFDDDVGDWDKGMEAPPFDGKETDRR